MSYQMPLLIAVSAITLLYACSRKSRVGKRHCVWIVTVILTAFSGFRSWWMGDLIKYYTLYLKCNAVDWQETVFGDVNNVGIRLFFRLAGRFHISYDVCIFLIAALVAVSLGVLVFRYSPSPYWSYLIYIAMGFYLFSYSGLKQSIAMSLLIFAACGYFEEKPLKATAWILVAALFHAPALIFLLLAFLPTKRSGMRYFVIVAVLFAVCFIFKGQLVTFLSQLYYDDVDTYENINEVGGRFIMMLIIMVMALVLRPLKGWDSIYFRTFNIMVLAALCQMFSVYNNNFSRLSDYFYQFVVLFIPLMLENGYRQAEKLPEHADNICYWDKRVYWIASVGITIFAFWYYSSYVQSSATLLNDFKFFWQIDPYSLYGT